MFKIKIIAVGKVKEEYFRSGIAEYVKRLNKYCSVEMIEIKEENLSDVKKTLKLEAENIISRVKGKSYALCVEGKEISSAELAKLVSSSVDAGEELTFIIGSSYGLDESVKSAVSGKISFSKMTFPHTLARLILTEQLYRAFTIINGNTYHK